MDDRNGNAPCVPIRNVPVRLYLPDVKLCLDAVEVVLVPVGDKDGLAVRALNQVLQGVQLLVVDKEGLAHAVIDRAVRHLQELAGEGGGIGGVDFRFFQADDHFLLQLVV